MTMQWPPVKAWTSKIAINGRWHFVAINYGGSGNSRWVNLVSVLDGNVCIKVLWPEINNNLKWSVGWLEVTEEISEKIGSNLNSPNKLDISSRACLHPSFDSGFDIPIKSKSIRDWT